MSVSTDGPAPGVGGRSSGDDAGDPAAHRDTRAGPRVDLLIPVFNEVESLPALFEALAPLRADGTVRTVVIADNGSTDGSAAMARHLGAMVVCEARRGYGSACLRGIAALAGQAEPPEALVFLDADLSDDPSMLPDLVAPILRGEAVIVIGSRVKCAEPGALNVVQRFGNRLACALMRALGGRAYSDLGPFRAIRWDALQELRMADPTWGWTVEMQMKAALLGLPVAEIDVPYRRRRQGRSKISGTVGGVLRAGTKIIVTIVALRCTFRGARPPGRS